MVFLYKQDKLYKNSIFLINMHYSYTSYKMKQRDYPICNFFLKKTFVSFYLVSIVEGDCPSSVRVNEEKIVLIFISILSLQS